MRPPEQVTVALLDAAQALAGPEHGPTLAELAAHAQVGALAARRSVANLTRRGRLRIVRTRQVDYRNRPVAEYALPVQPLPGLAAEGCGSGCAGVVNLTHALAEAWR